MDAPGPPPGDARTLLASDAKLRKGVLGYAYTVTHQIEEARAVAQEAMTRVLEGQGWYAWTPGGVPDVNYKLHVATVTPPHRPRSQRS
jgi:hypothetical protein